jgi:transposase-like protein
VPHVPDGKLRTAVRSRGHFPNDEAATKLLFLVLRQVSVGWRMPSREWAAAKTQFAVMFGDRFSVEGSGAIDPSHAIFDRPTRLLLR